MKLKKKDIEGSRSSYRELVEDVNSIVLLMDAEGTIIFFNNFAEELFGYTKEKIIGQNVVGTIIPETESTGRDLKEMILGIGRNPEKYKSNINENMGNNGERIWVSWTNKPVFDENGRVVEILCAGNDVTERRQAKKALEYRSEFDRLITSISTSFINLASDEVDGGIKQALQAIGEFVGVDRSYVFLLSDDGTKMDNTHEWCAEGIEPQINNLKELPVDTFPWWMEKLNQFETVYVPRVADLPPEASAEKEILQPQGIQSLIIVPMVYGRSLVGFLRFDSVRAEKRWSEEIISLIKIVGEILTNALEHKRLVEELESSKAYFQQFFNSSPVPLTLIGLNGKRLDCNPAMEELTGRSKEELVNVPVGDIYSEEEQLMIKKKLVNGTIEKGYVHGFETYFSRPDGTKLPVVANTSLIKGRPPSIIYSATDISELRKREEEIKDAKAFSDQIINAIVDPICVVDNEGRWVRANPAWGRVVGYKPEELLGKRTKEQPFVTPELTEIREEKLWKPVYEKGMVTNVEIPYTHKNGKEIIGLASESLLKDAKGNNIGRVLVIKDITEERKREAKIEELVVYLNVAMDSSPDILLVFNREGFVTYINKEFEGDFGYTKEECIGLTIERLADKILPEEEAPFLVKEIRELLETGEKIMDVELEAMNKERERFSMIYSASGIFDASNHLIGAVISIRNVEKKYKEYIEEAKRYVERWGEIKEK
ncbi:MAG: sensory histidine kinase AtoS [Candidatus Methanolliviera sp. GoM_asphalt]|nr:MAG: sensory histidine kinase AtoS [Candidatus Methanolliviera sp. GoM_asphalt]